MCSQVFANAMNKRFLLFLFLFYVRKCSYSLGNFAHFLPIQTRMYAAILNSIAIVVLLYL